MKTGCCKNTFLLTWAMFVAVAAIPGSVQPVSAQSAGDLDESFGSGGVVTVSIPSSLNTISDEAAAVAIQGDGKIVAAGTSDVGSAQGSRFAVVRLEADGSLDSGFGIGGIATVAVSALDDRAAAVAIQGDGQIVTVGTGDIPSAAGSRFAALRILGENTDGGRPGVSPGTGGGCFVGASRNE